MKFSNLLKFYHLTIILCISLGVLALYSMSSIYQSYSEASNLSKNWDEQLKNIDDAQLFLLRASSLTDNSLQGQIVLDQKRELFKAELNINNTLNNVRKMLLTSGKKDKEAIKLLEQLKKNVAEANKFSKNYFEAVLKADHETKIATRKELKKYYSISIKELGEFKEAFNRTFYIVAADLHFNSVKQVKQNISIILIIVMGIGLIFFINKRSHQLVQAFILKHPEALEETFFEIAASKDIHHQQELNFNQNTAEEEGSKKAS